MALNKGLTDRISEVDLMHGLTRALLHEFINQGGTPELMDDLLAEAGRETRPRIKESVRVWVGEIWKHVDIPIDLGLSTKDFEIPAKEFIKKYPNIDFHPGVKFSENNPKPGRPCQYKLLHYEMALLTSEISNGFSGPNGELIEHAGWREHLAFVSMLGTKVSKSYVMALGSIILPGDDRKAFPMAWMVGSHVPQKPQIVWCNDTVFGQECFYLVRDNS